MKVREILFGKHPQRAEEYIGEAEEAKNRLARLQTERSKARGEQPEDLRMPWEKKYDWSAAPVTIPKRK